MNATGAKGLIRGLYAIVDSTYLSVNDMPERARELLEGGARVLQLRAKDLGAGETLEAARKLRAETRKYGALFIVNDRVDVAMLTEADGVHLGQTDLPVEDARRLLGPGAIIGHSTHDAKEAREAGEKGADYISFGPVFPTRTKMDAESPRGVTLLKEVRAATRLPIVAIGGITEENMQEVLSAGADSVAMISELLTATDAGAKARSVVTALKAARPS